MRLLVVNVNTSTDVTATIRAQAQAVAAPGTEVVALTPTFGASSVEGSFESYLSAVAVLDAVVRHTSDPANGPVDAVVQAGFGEHGREALQELLDVPVVDITEAAAHTACLLGHSYTVVTTLDRVVPQIRDRLLLAGLLQRCASVRATGLGVAELEDDVAATAKAVAHQARAAVEEDGAEVVVLGCAGMAGLGEAVAAEVDVPVVDGVAAAVKLAESLVHLGLTTSKVRAYARPVARPLAGWPLARPA